MLVPPVLQQGVIEPMDLYVDQAQPPQFIGAAVAFGSDGIVAIGYTGVSSMISEVSGGSAGVVVGSVHYMPESGALVFDAHAVALISDSFTFPSVMGSINHGNFGIEISISGMAMAVTTIPADECYSGGALYLFRINVPDEGMWTALEVGNSFGAAASTL